ncbi:hypothetical protein IJ21_29590 [Paenibacillus sp. 32O-W]|uniref:Uncharacterized protein n=2 Tax=Paenibacillus cisolokensis TaxID=1658519 RepID=A0ABQ4ND96_9BACL|nr:MULTISPECIES: hypothetical protein [Paenibacillus]ALS28355.1 hypothetical protein IJ21_29590 [Paenibacillus sp. 32O-W]GIQ66160.1 hypothetical protein PACILC2_47280 [Paenibacillus cisolokensis]
MEEKLKRYFELKKLAAEVNEELGKLRNELLDGHDGIAKRAYGDYILKINVQDRREYSDDKLQEAFPDPALWRLMSTHDAGKIAGLVKLAVVTEEQLRHTYRIRRVQTLTVQKL